MRTSTHETESPEDFSESIFVRGVILKRSDFGKGRPGQLAWTGVLAGVECEALVEGKKCGIPMIGTTDYDVLGTLEQKPHCSEDHHKLIMFVVGQELQQMERTSTFGKNGLGRG